MSTDEMNRKIAEACGWTGIEYMEPIPEPIMAHAPDGTLMTGIPNYCEDLNACHEMEKTLATTDKRPEAQTESFRTNRSADTGGQGVIRNFNPLHPECTYVKNIDELSLIFCPFKAPLPLTLLCQ